MVTSKHRMFSVPVSVRYTVYPSRMEILIELAELSCHDSHDGPHTVLSFIKYQRGIAVDNFVCDFLRVARQAVQEDGTRVGLGHEFGVYLVSFEFRDTLGVFCFLSHADPCVSDDNVGTLDRLVGDGCGEDLGVIFSCQLQGEGHNVGVCLVSLGGGNSDVHSHLDGSEHEVVKDVVSITDPADRLSRQIHSEMLLQSHEVS
mmetsp:Transcript_18123/g.51185  ORF Transcript_18123/g.51185 Transcript_18123/m.51185 type:complete len:202 (-) Transcript_18123:157-762(-)